MLFLFKIGFLPIRIWDVLDIFIVGYLMYQLYKLLRGTIAFNIFVGVLTLYVVWWIVGQLQMDLLSQVLNQFASVGVIVIVVVFQQEIRRFLLFLGNTALERQVELASRFLGRNTPATDERERQKGAIRIALQRMSRSKTGALIVLSDGANLEGIVSAGLSIDANISEPLIESIFNKESPLHDGAVLIANGKIEAASCVLPVSENTQLPDTAGMRHRAAVGVSEKANVAAFVVSEENGRISLAFKGLLEEDLDEARLKALLEKHYK